MHQDCVDLALATLYALGVRQHARLPGCVNSRGVRGRAPPVGTLLLIALLLIALLGQPTAALASQATTVNPAPAGYHETTLRLPASPISPRMVIGQLAVPDSWATLDTSVANVDRKLRDFRKKRPELANVLPRTKADLERYTVFLLATDTDRHALYNTLVAELGDASAYTLPGIDEIRSDLQRSYENFEIRQIELDTGLPKRAFRQKQMLGSGDYKVAIEIEGIEPTHHFHVTGYYLFMPTEGMLTFTFLTNDDGRSDQTVQTIIHSLRLRAG